MFSEIFQLSKIANNRHFFVPARTEGKPCENKAQIIRVHKVEVYPKVINVPSP